MHSHDERINRIAKLGQTLYGRLLTELGDDDVRWFKVTLAYQEIFANTSVHHDASGLTAQLDRIEQALGRIIKLEVKQMGLAQDVKDRIARQTTIIGSIKEWIRNLPTNTVTEEEKAALFADLDRNETDLNTVIPVNTPPVDPNAPV